MYIIVIHSNHQLLMNRYFSTAKCSHNGFRHNFETVLISVFNAQSLSLWLCVFGSTEMLLMTFLIAGMMFRMYFRRYSISALSIMELVISSLLKSRSFYI